MSEKRKTTERGYCTNCGRWLEVGEEHDWEKHPATIHGDIERANRLASGDGDG